MSVAITAAGLREILLEHDPLGAWPGAGPNPDGYEGEARQAAENLTNMLGLGHAWTVVADAIDKRHPGFYRAVKAGDPEVGRRLGLVARAIWDRHGNIVRRAPVKPREYAGSAPEPPSATALLSNPELLEAWLRTMEGRLDVDSARPVAERESPALLQAVLKDLVDAYAAAPSGAREDARTAFSRFRRCCYQLATFAGRQHAALGENDPARALRRALVAESLLDLNLDWRDELLLIQDLKRRSAVLALPYSELLELAAGLSSARTADFLRNA